MNNKRKYKTDFKPEFLHEIPVTSGTKTYTLVKGMLVSVHRKPGLIAGKYEFLYAEKTATDTLIVVEGPVSRIVSERFRKVIRQADIKQVHLKARK